MYIKNIRIISFGMIKDREFDFDRGLNVIEGDNETGKSTVGTFIKFIFYGLSKAEKEKYVGWGEQGCSGTLTLEYKGETYRIERELIVSRAKDKITVIGAGGYPVRTEKSPAEMFLGVPESVYVNTAFTGQLGSALNGSDLPEATENILFSADEAVNTRKALKKLDEARVALLYRNKKGGKIYELENTVAELEYKLATAKSASEQIFTLDDSIRTNRQRKETNKQKAALISAQLDEYDAYKRLEAYALHEENKKELENKQKALEELEEKYRQNGSIPDQEFISELHELEAEMAELKSNDELFGKELLLSEAESAKAGGSTAVKIAAGAGGTDRLKEMYDGIVKKYSSVHTVSLICLAVSLTAIAAGAVFFILDMLMPYLLICAAIIAVSAVLFAVFSLKASKMKTALEKLAAKLGAENYKQVPEILEKVSADADFAAEKSAALKSARENKRRSEEKLAAFNEKVKAVTGKYKQTDINGLSAYIDEAESVAAELSAAHSEVEMAQYKASVSGEKADTDVELLKARIKGVLPAAEYRSFNCDMKRTELNWLIKQNESLEEKLTSDERSLAAANATFTLPSQIYAKLNEARRQLSDARDQYEAYVMAYDKLNEASKTLRDSISPTLAKYSGELMKGFTDGKYDSLGISHNFDITYSGGGMTHAADTLSSGTQDLAYISLRLSLVKLLFPEGTAVFFDDTFARIDDGRTARIMKTLASSGRQCIVFTCHAREGKCAGFFGGKVFKV